MTSHVTARERVELFELARQPNVRAIAEIGSYFGASALALAAGLRSVGNTQAKIYCVDTWQNDAMSEGRGDTMTTFLRNIAPYADTIVPVRGWSTAVVEQVAAAAGRVDLLFIDGDHSYAGCVADWQAYRALLNPGARVAFHDVNWAAGVRRVVEEEVRPLVRSYRRLPNLWWGELA